MARVIIDGIETDMMPAMFSFSSEDCGDRMLMVRYPRDTDDEWAGKVADMAKHGYYMDAEQPGTDDASRRESLERFVAAQRPKP